jgi:hypothetical protein
MWKRKKDKAAEPDPWQQAHEQAEAKRAKTKLTDDLQKMWACYEHDSRPAARRYTGPAIPLSLREVRDMRYIPMPGASVLHLTKGPFAPFTLCRVNAGRRLPANRAPGMAALSKATCPRCIAYVLMEASKEADPSQGPDSESNRLLSRVVEAVGAEKANAALKASKGRPYG